MDLVLIGNTGSGKTTLARHLAELWTLPHISSGEIARQLGETDPATRMALQQGMPAPEQAQRLAVQRRIEAASVESGGYILEGFPRTIAQAICLMNWQDAMPLFLLLDVPEYACIERLVTRGRPDDNADSIARKLVFFREETQPMIDLLEDGGVLHILPQGDLDDLVGRVESLVP